MRFFLSKQSNVFVFVRSFSIVKCSYNHVILAWFSCHCHGLYPRLATISKISHITYHNTKLALCERSVNDTSKYPKGM